MMTRPDSAEGSAATKQSAEYQDLTIEETLRLLQSESGGLPQLDAEARVAEVGYNEILEEKRSPVTEFLLHYWGPMPWLMEFTAVLSFLLGHALNAAIVLILLTINSLVGYANSSRSHKALDLLRKRVATKTNVLRDGEWRTVESRDLVPGDVIQIGLGEIVPADSKLIRGELFADESALTGESLPVPLHQSDVVYSGAIVTEGEARCIVVNTGESTTFGIIGRLVRKAHPASHQTKMVLDVTKHLLRFSLIALLLTSVYAFVISAQLPVILSLAVMLLMGSIPVALPTVLAVVESIGSLELAHRGALVTRLDSIEDAASVDVICIDKTGTITQNWLSVVEVVAFAGRSEGEVSLAAALASREGVKDPIDELIIRHARSSSLHLDLYEQVSFTPFTPSIKRSEAIIKSGIKQFRVTKGAPQVVVNLCSPDPDTIALFNSKLEEFSRRGHRSLAVAESDPDNPDKLNLMGLVAIANPIRPDSKDMIDQLRAMGVRPVMLTGDTLSIAREIGQEASVGARIVRLSELKDALDSPDIHVLDYDGFAEIYPEDKYKIVRMLQSNGHFVGMTGDGVNDAPALKQAEMGIAVKNATDVAKASASIVLTEDGVGVITDAIMSSRRIYQRMLSWVINKVAKTVQMIGVLTLGFVWLHDLAISLTGMVLIVLSNDFPTMSLATDNVKGTPNPDAWNMRNITLLGLAVGLMLVAQGMFTILIGLDFFGMNADRLSGYLTLTLILTSQFRILVLRERAHFWSSRPGNELLMTAIATSVVFSLVAVILSAVTYVELLSSLLISGLFTLILVDPVKYWISRKLGF